MIELKSPNATNPSKSVHMCRNHVDTPATWRCEPCHRYFCGKCIAFKQIRDIRIEICPACGENLLPLAVCTEYLQPKPFLSQLPGAFLYPLRGSTLFVFLIGGVLFGLGTYIFVAAWFMVPLAIAFLYFYGFLCSYFFNIITSSADGEDKFPDRPDFTDIWNDILRPVVLTAGIVLVSFLPIYIISSFFIDLEREHNLALIPLTLGLLYMPMGFLAVAIHDTIWAVNPFRVIRSIYRVADVYLLACLPLLIIPVVNPQLSAIPTLGPFLARLVIFYLLMVDMRILGLVYFTHKKQLGWF